jgi:hypothetical protein
MFNKVFLIIIFYLPLCYFAPLILLLALEDYLMWTYELGFDEIAFSPLYWFVCTIIFSTIIFFIFKNDLKKDFTKDEDWRKDPRFKDK